MVDHHPYLDRVYYSSPVQALERESQAKQNRAGRSISSPAFLSVDFRHSGWKGDRERVMRSFVRTHQKLSRMDEFRTCGSHAYVLQNADDPSDYRLAGSACHDRFCVPCATERSYVIAGNVNRIIADREVRFLTLTIKTDDMPLADALDKLYKSFQALRRRAFWTKAVTGGVAFCEIKWIKATSRWHPHLHCLIEGTWIDQKEIKHAWHAITGDSFIVDIRMPGSSTAVARYVAKYASKPLNTSFSRDDELLDEAILAMAGRKLAITFGRWRGELLTQTKTEGTWINLGSLESMIAAAASGPGRARDIIESLTDRDLSDLYERAPPWKPMRARPPANDGQATFFGVWLANGSYRYRYDA